MYRQTTITEVTNERGKSYTVVEDRIIDVIFDDENEVPKSNLRYVSSNTVREAIEDYLMSLMF